MPSGTTASLGRRKRCGRVRLRRLIAHENRAFITYKRLLADGSRSTRRRRSVDLTACSGCNRPDARYLRCLVLEQCYASPVVLRLNTLQNVRASLARVARETARGTLDVSRGSLLTRQCVALLAHDRSMVALDIDERLAAIEERLDQADEAWRAHR